MAELAFHKCKICGCIFHHGKRDSYCSKCVPKGSMYSAILNYGFVIKERRQKENGKH